MEYKSRPTEEIGLVKSWWGSFVDFLAITFIMAIIFGVFAGTFGFAAFVVFKILAGVTGI